MRCARQGRAGQPAVLDDYAYLGEGLLTLYETTGKVRYLRAAERCARSVITDFYDEHTGRVNHRRKHSHGLPLNIAESHDGPLPNATATAADLLGRLSYHCNRGEWRELARTLVHAHGEAVERFPRGHTDMLRVARRLVEQRTIIVFVPGEDTRANELLRRACFERHLPGQILAILPQNAGAEERELPLFSHRIAAYAKPQVYVCHDDYCEAPVQSINALDQVLPPMRSHKIEVRSE
jgi:uncharacterized protein